MSVPKIGSTIARAVHPIYNAVNLHASTGSFKMGAALLALTAGGIALTSTKQKKSLADRYVSVVHKAGADPEMVSDREIKDALWKSLVSADNVFVSSPLFYAIYQAIHKTGLPMGHHLMQSILKGFTGTVASLPAIGVFYGAAATLLPIIESQLMKSGYAKKEAQDLSQGVVFLAMGAPVEFVVEAIGCGIKPSQLKAALGSALIGTACITTRLAFGVLLQFRGLNKAGDVTWTDTLKSFGTMVAGTTIGQHGINATMQSITYGTGVKGIGKYVMTGRTDGTGGLSGGVKQLGLTGAQRVAFCAAWSALTQIKRPMPEALA